MCSYSSFFKWVDNKKIEVFFVIFASNQTISRGELFCTLAENDLEKGLLNMNYEIFSDKKGHKLYRFFNSDKSNKHKGGKKSKKIIFRV